MTLLKKESRTAEENKHKIIMDITDRLNEFDKKVEEMEESEAEFSQY